MAKKTAPNEEARIVAMRRAGWSVPAIVSETGKSSATINRILSKHQTTKGADIEALVASSRAELLVQFTNDDAIRSAYARLQADVMAHLALGSERSARAIELLEPTDLKSAALALRGIAAHSTATKNYADTFRHMFPAPPTAPDDLPILQVLTLGEEDIAQMRKEQREQDAILNGEDLEESTEEETCSDVVETI